MDRMVLKVRMLGAFEMSYGEKEISFERNTATKTNQLLQLLLLAGKKGISRELLLKKLFGREEVTNPANSLRATVFRLRKLLVEAGLPQKDEYIHIKGGIYRFTNEIPVELDIKKYEEYIRLAGEQVVKEQRMELLEAVCDLYKGDFLAPLQEEWVIEERTVYKEQYGACMKELCALLKAQKEYKHLYQTAEKAVEIYPYEEWQIWQIDSLIAQNHMKAAMRLYEETAEQMFRGGGLLPSKQFKERLASMNSDIERNADHIGIIQSALEEDEKEQGAFYCSYPSFAESYRYMKRIIERYGQSAYLLVCTITDGKGEPLDRSERLEMLAGEVTVAIKNALRRGDLYTKYSDNQFLILLLNTRQQDCVTVIDRINARFENPSRKNYLKYQIASINDEEK